MCTQEAVHSTIHRFGADVCCRHSVLYTPAPYVNQHHLCNTSPHSLERLSAGLAYIAYIALSVVSSPSLKLHHSVVSGQNLAVAS